MFRALSPLMATMILTIFVGQVRANTITVNSNEDTTVMGDGKCTLREALNNANTDSEMTGGDCAFGMGNDLIKFSVGSGPITIQATATFGIGPGTTVDATTQPGFAGTPIVELDGSLAGGGSSGLVIYGSNALVRGLVINRFPAHGVYFLGASQSRIVGNYIGTDKTGTIAQGNALSGVFIENSSSCTVGGFLLADRNVISGNNSSGVLFVTNANNNSVSGNYIGVDATGTAALSNGGLMTGLGVFIAAGSGNSIGGATPGMGNVISSHDKGIWIDGGGIATSIQGNFIGTNAAGTAAIPNRTGIHLSGGGAFSLIGSSVSSGRNIISGNMFQAILLEGPECHDLLIKGNYIGVDVGGTTALRNSIGIFVAATAAGAPVNNGIGGTFGTEGNVIAFNDLNLGVLSSGANHPTGIRIRRNSIFGPAMNPGIVVGLDLGVDGFTPNDLNDPDVGPNALQNFPVLTSAMTCGATTLVSGSFNSTANSAFTLEFFSTPPADFVGGGRGKTFLGSLDITTNAMGNAIFAAPVTGTTVGNFITATATSNLGNTSEFSIPVAAASGLPPVISQGNGPLILMIQPNSNCPNAANQLTFSATDADTPVANLAWTVSTPPTKGTVSFISGGIGQNVTVCYKPNAGPGAADSYTLRVTDTCGLTDQITVNVVPQGVNIGPPDGAPPVMACPGNTSIIKGQSIDPSRTGTPAVLDAIDPAPIVTFADVNAPRPCPEISLITRTWRATDASGNSTTCQQTITVFDSDLDGDGLRDCEDPIPIEAPVALPLLNPNDLCGVGLCASGTAMAVPLTLIGLAFGKRRRR